MRARLRMSLLLVGVFLGPGISWGQASSQTEKWLVWSAPPECPRSDHIEDQLHRWLGADYDLAGGEVSASASVTWEEEKWTVLVHLRRGENESSRSVVVGSCTEAADFVALSVTLLIDPELSAGPDQMESSTAQSVDREGTDDSSVEESKPDDTHSIFIDEPAPATVEAEQQRVDSNPRKERGFPQMSLGAGAGLLTGMFPVATPTAFFRFGLRPEGWRFRLGVLSAPHIEHKAERARGPAVFRSLLGHGEVCRMWTSRSLALGPCLGLEAGALAAEEKGSRATPLFWSAVQVLVSSELNWSWGGTFLQLGARAPFTRTAYVLQGGTIVHESQAGFDGKVGFSIFL